MSIEQEVMQGLAQAADALDEDRATIFSRLCELGADMDMPPAEFIAEVRKALDEMAQQVEDDRLAAQEHLMEEVEITAELADKLHYMVDSRLQRSLGAANTLLDHVTACNKALRAALLSE